LVVVDARMACESEKPLDSDFLDRRSLMIVNHHLHLQLLISPPPDGEDEVSL
jgi:hypothetical protein